MKKRGQAAMEFLMTYGWVILIILIVIAALYYLGLFDTKTQATLSFDTPGTLMTKGIIIDQSGATIELELSSGASATVTDVKIDGNPCDGGGFTATTLHSGTNIIKCPKGGLSQGQDVKVDVTAEYTSAAGSIPHTTTASGSGTVEKINYETMLKDPSIVALYRFEGDAKDSSGNGNDGTIINSLDCNQAGKIGKACQFTGTVITGPPDRIDGSGSYGYIKVPLSLLQNLGTKYTLSSWVYLDNKDYSWQAWFGKDCGGGRGYSFYFGHNGAKPFYYGCKDATCNPNYWTYYGTSWLANGWHSMIITRDNNIYKFYQDGVLTGTDTDSTHIEQGSFSGCTTAQIGRVSTGYGFKGKIDDLALFNNRILTLEEITVLANP